MDDQQDQVSNVSNLHLTLLFTFSVVAAVSVLINIRVFYIIFISSKRKSRPANILVAHISSVVIGFTIVIYIYVLEKTNVTSLAAPQLCNVFAFLRNNIYNMFPVNAGAIIWIRTRLDATLLRKIFAYRSLGIMWLFTIVINLPSTFMVEYVQNQDESVDKCKEIRLLDSFGATIGYEILRFLLFNVMVCLYLIRGTIKIRSSIKNIRKLKLVQSESLRKRIHQVRFVYLHTFVFILNWFPNGLGLLLYKIFSRLGWDTDYVKFLTPFVFLNYSAFVLCPLSYVFLLEDISCRKFFIPCFRKKLPNLPVYIANNEEVEPPEQFGWRANPILRPKSTTAPKQKSPTASNKVEDKKDESHVNIELIEMSQMTTVGLTGTSGTIYVTANTSKSVQNPVYTQGPSIPSLFTPTTSAKLQNITVQIHKEPETKQDKEMEEPLNEQDSETSD